MKKNKSTSRATRYRSGYEGLVAACLEKLGYDFEYEKKILEYIIKRKYYLDFFVEKCILIESKGYFKSSDRSKHLELQKQHPEVEVKFLFQADNKLSKKSKTRYSDWATKHGFDYEISPKGIVPKRWLKSLRK